MYAAQSRLVSGIRCWSSTCDCVCSTDVRPGVCYLEVRDDTRSRPPHRHVICDRALASNLTMKQCCCSVGLGWNAVEDQQRGQPCVACPIYGSSTNRCLILAPQHVRLYGVGSWRGCRERGAIPPPFTPPFREKIGSVAAVTCVHSVSWIESADNFDVK